MEFFSKFDTGVELDHSQSAPSLPSSVTLLMQIDDLTAQLDAASSKCLRLDKESKFFHQELLSLKAIQEKCEKLENENRKWKQEVVNLRRHMQMNMVECSEVQQYQWTIEERARRYRQEVLEEANLFPQVTGPIFNALYFISLQITLWSYTVYVFPLLPLITVCRLQEGRWHFFLLSVFQFLSLSLNLYFKMILTKGSSYF